MPKEIPLEMPRIGAFVLETLTTGMYTNPLDTLREYIQNSFDSIRKSERSKLLKEGAGRIEIRIDEKKRQVRIRDNGIGVSSAEVCARLVDIGMSTKDIETDAGFRGIGRLAGIAYCDRLLFQTQGAGEPEISTVRFDCESLRQSMSPRMKKVRELVEVLRKHANVTRETTRKKDHFLEVRMENVNEAGNLFMKSADIRRYLSQVAPVGLDTQSFALAGKIERWIREQKIRLPTVSIVVTSGTSSFQVFRPYKKLTYTTKKEKHKIHVKDIRFFPEDAGRDSPFWIWYGDTNCPGAFGDDVVSGFRLRKANIGIGMSERMTEIFGAVSESYARFNKYFMGEIHIQEPNVIPNARRDGFEDSAEWSAVRESLVDFARDRSRDAYQLSQARNMDVERLVGAAQKVVSTAEKMKKTGLASKEEKTTLLEKMDKHISKLDAAKRAERNSKDTEEINEVRRQLEKARNTIERETRFTAQNLDTSLDRKQRKIISEIISLLYHVLDEPTFEKVRDAILAKYQISDKGKRA